MHGPMNVKYLELYLLSPYRTVNTLNLRYKKKNFKSALYVEIIAVTKHTNVLYG